MFFVLLPCAQAAQENIVLIDVQRCCADIAYPQVNDLVRRELEALGYRVDIYNSNAATLELRDIGFGKQAALSLRVLRHHTRKKVSVELWDQSNGRTRTWSFSQDDGADSPRLIALRIIELVQLTLRPTSQALEAKPAEPQTAPKLTKDKSLANPWHIGMGMGALLFPGSAGTYAAVAPNVRWQTHPNWSLEADGLFSVFGAAVTQGSESADLRFGATRLWVLWYLAQGIVQPALGLGTGLVSITATGSDSESFVARRVRTISGVLGLTARLSWRFNASWALNIVGHGGVLGSDVAIAFGDDRVESLGRMIVDGVATLSAPTLGKRSWGLDNKAGTDER
ncbi:MAG: hypothetical protein R3C68_02160 [Myxococcota bacterium]